MNRHIRFLGIGLMVCFAALFVQLNRIQVFDQRELQANPVNNRQIERDFSRPRGAIITADGVVVADSVEVPGAELRRSRVYPEGDLYAHTTGYFSFQFGSEGVERVYNDQLSGRSLEQRFGDLEDLFRTTDTSADVILTLRHDLQTVAREALGDRRGSVVALDPRTGAILAFWSYPSYDPTPLGSVDLADGAAAWEAFDALAPVDDPRLARMYREIFFPGSTFKVVTAAAALNSGVATLTRPVLPVATTYTAPLTTTELGNFGGSSCGGTLLEALRVSCNTWFARAAAEIIGADAMIEAAEDFGFNDAPPIDLPAPATSVYPTDYGAVVGTTEGDPGVPLLENTPALAQTGIGQNDVKATPLEMALVAAAVANDGVMMAPHVMDEIRDRDGDIVQRADIRSWRSPVSGRPARALYTGMLDVVDNGSGRGLEIAGFDVGAKTGTAQVDAARPDDTHGWIIGFGMSERQEPTVYNGRYELHRPGSAAAAWPRCSWPATSCSTARWRSRCCSPSSPPTRLRRAVPPRGAGRGQPQPPQHRRRLRLGRGGGTYFIVMEYVDGPQPGRDPPHRGPAAPTGPPTSPPTSPPRWASPTATAWCTATSSPATS
jgi:penicillin-binding protein A